jgi:hypothetical protein
MPRGDRTGPNGAGPMTGRGMGVCNPGLARGRMFCPRWGGTFTQSNMVLSEEEEKKILEAEKADIEKRLKELKSK